MSDHAIADDQVPGAEAGFATSVGAWGASWRLALVVSTVAGLLAATFADRMAHSTLIVAVIAGASLIGWYGAEHAPACRGGSRR